MTNPLKRGPWKLSDLKSVKQNGLTVFSCFHCGGGSTMGYKLAGYNVLGGVEIDPKMVEIYRTNHAPKYSYAIGVQEFKQLNNLPEELYDLDILDGSPPCSSFSMAGSREKAWGTSKKFREGQADQVLDDLFFEFIEIAAKLKPKVVIAENVKGLITGNARGYVKQIFTGFDKAGYDVQLFLLDALTMGVPQRRERVFFIARRKDLNLKPITLDFKEPIVTIEKALNGKDAVGVELREGTKENTFWAKCMPGRSLKSVPTVKGWYSHFKINPKSVAPTIVSSCSHYHWSTPARVNGNFYKAAQSFPDDFNFLNEREVYICGMSVPPFMMQRIADQVERQWLPEVRIRK